MHQGVTKFKLNKLACATSLLIGATLHQVPYAVAEEASERGISLEEVVVTAEKRAANVQDIPVAISAFSQDALDEDGITDLQSVQQSVPSLQFTTQSNFGAGVIVTLRGIGTSVTTSGADQGVALHNDGVYLGKASAGLLSFYDMERLEVLRGPQGTLYGRNATGGSINLISAKPSEEFEAFGDVMVGDYNHRRLRGVVGGGITEGVAGRLTATWAEHDGYIENLWPGGEDIADKDEWNIRSQLLFDVNEDIEVLARVSAAEASSAGAAAKTLAYPAALNVGIIQPGPFAGTPFGVPIFQPAFDSAQPAPTDLHKVRTDGNESFDQEAVGANITVSWDLESVSFKSISAWFNNETTVIRDGDGSELPLYIKGRTEESEQFSQEFNLASNADGKLEWLLGAFFYQEESVDKDTFVNFFPNASIPGATGYNFSFDSSVETTSWALFGQASYYLTEQLKATLGLRYSEDKKEGETVNRNVVDATTGVTLVGFPQSGKYSETWEEPTGKIGLDYFINEDSMAYISFSKGYKSGGLNVNAPDQAVFAPELIDAWEIGSKNRFFDNRVELNLSAFYYEYTDLQLFSVTESAPFIQNAAESTIKGLEIESKVAATEQLAFNFAISYLDSEINDFITKDPADPAPRQVLEDLSGNQLPRAPELEVNLGVSYSWDLGHGELTLSGQYHWQDDMFFRPQNDEDKMQEAYDTVDARLTYLSADERWRISAFGKNLADEQAISNLLIEAGLFGSPAVVTPNNPRTFGVEVGYRFQ